MSADGANMVWSVLALHRDMQITHATGEQISPGNTYLSFTQAKSFHEIFVRAYVVSAPHRR
jgi:hypothetical protein